MNNQNYIQCPLCSIENMFHKSGIQTHFKHKHKLSWKNYKQEHVTKRCLTCGEKLLRENMTCCSAKCSHIYAASTKKRNVKKKMNSFKNKIEMQYLNLKHEEKNEIVNLYSKEFISLTQISKKFLVEVKVIKRILEENKIEINSDDQKQT